MHNYYSVAQLAAAGLALQEQGRWHYARQAHLITLSVQEVAAMACDAPVFISQQPDGSPCFAVLCSLQSGHNLLVDHAAAEPWLATYQPLLLRSYPCVADGEQLWFARDPHCWQSTGAALFFADGRASASATALGNDARQLWQQEKQSYLVLRQLQQLQLIRPLVLVMRQRDGSEQRLRGLSSIDEDRLQALDAAALHQLQQQGVLPVLYQLLSSLLQLNKLLRLHNQQVRAQSATPWPSFTQVRLEVERA